MRVLVACEYSGVVRDAFRARGHDAISCDLRPTLQGGPHAQGDVRAVLRHPWDLVIAHPPCTYMTNARAVPDYSHLMSAIEFFVACQQANAPMVCVENPTTFKVARQVIGEPSDVIQPYEFGEPYRKRTCLWLKGLPPLLKQFSGAERGSVMSWVDSGSGYHSKRVQFTGGERKHRAANRTLFFPGIARAMAEQWG